MAPRKVRTDPGGPARRGTRSNVALSRGSRCLPGGSSLAQLLYSQRGAENWNLGGTSRALTVAEILRWVDAHHARTGEWPDERSGAIPECPGETWLAVHGAIRRGDRGLRRGSSMALFLAEHRGLPHRLRRPDLLIPQIVSWAERIPPRNGQWPNSQSGRIPESPGRDSGHRPLRPSERPARPAPRHDTRAALRPRTRAQITRRERG